MVETMYNIHFQLTATTDINASADEVEFSVHEAVKAQSPVQMDSVSVSVKENAVLEAEDEYQMFTGTVIVNVLTVQDEEDSDTKEIRQGIIQQVSSIEYQDDSGLCRLIVLNSDE